MTASRSPPVLGGEPGPCSAYLADVVSRLPSLTSLSLLGPDWVVNCRSLSDAKGVNLSERPYFREALAAPGPSSVNIASTSKKAVLPIALSIRDESGGVRGILLAAADLDWLDAELKARGLPPDGSVTLADRDGTLLAREPFPERFVGTKIPAEFMYLLHEPKLGLSRGARSRLFGREGVRV